MMWELGRCPEDNTRPEPARPSSLVSPRRIPPGTGPARRQPDSRGGCRRTRRNKYFLVCAQLYTRGDPASSHLRFLPTLASIRASFQQEHPCNSRIPCPSLCCFSSLKPRHALAADCEGRVIATFPPPHKYMDSKGNSVIKTR